MILVQKKKSDATVLLHERSQLEKKGGAKQVTSVEQRKAKKNHE